MTKAVVDIETDGLDATKIHCIVAKSYTSNKTKTWIGEECKQFPTWASQITEFIMHNGVSFDGPVINKLLGKSIPLTKIRDTLLESQLYNPIREGGHSLESWGERLSYPKGEFNEFYSFNPEMLEYCKRDAELTKKVAMTLEDESKYFSTKSYDMECKVRAIIDRQQTNGFAFNLREAMSLYSKLMDEQTKLEGQAEETFEPTQIKLKTKTKEIPFNIASRMQIADRLMKRGWKPTRFGKEIELKDGTTKRNVIVSEEILDKVNMPEAKMFSRYFLLQKRTGLLKSWIKECQEDGRVHGKVLTLRTVTGRMAHHSPNMAQVPAIYSPIGKECRSLWTVSNPETHSLVGTDASGLEIRCLAHYMNDPEFTNTVLSGDVHTANQKAAGLKTRDQAKTFIYAFLYGAGAAKIGKVVGGNAQQGQVLINKFLSNMPALKRLRENVQERVEKHDTIKGLDGRLLHIRSPHAALNTLIQGGGAIICKQWLVHLIEGLTRAALDARLVASVHDEYQFEVAKADIERFCRLTKEAMKQTQRTLEVRCELDCDYKVGRTWADTH